MYGLEPKWKAGDDLTLAVAWRVDNLWYRELDGSTPAFKDFTISPLQIQEHASLLKLGTAAVMAASALYL